MYSRRADSEEANFPFFLIHISQCSVKETNKQVKQAANKKRGAYNKISPTNFITHEIYVFWLFWQINEIYTHKMFSPYGTYT